MLPTTVVLTGGRKSVGERTGGGGGGDEGGGEKKPVERVNGWSRPARVVYVRHVHINIVSRG